VDKLYKTAYDWWLQLMLALPMLTGSAVIVAGLATGNDRLRTTGVLGTAGYCLLLGALVMPMTYVIRKGGLVIRFGMVRQRVPWDRIVDIVPSSSPISAPAMSLKRLDVRYQKGNGRETHTLISPADRAAFVRDCAEASGRHVVDGDKLVEKPT
jgi:hypothetical protein